MIHIDQDSDYVPGRPLRLSSIAIVAAIVISVIATIVLVGGRGVTDTLHIATTRPARIDAQPFVFSTPAEQIRTQADHHLDSYGWVDRASGTIHVPIDVAIEHYLGARR